MSLFAAAAGGGGMSEKSDLVGVGEKDMDVDMDLETLQSSSIQVKEKIRKKKRSSNSECINLDLLNDRDHLDHFSTSGSSKDGGADMNDFPLINRYQSHRTAAVIAKTKLATPRQGYCFINIFIL